MSDQPQTPPEKLYAGKFSTVEALEEGYNNGAAVYEENQKLKSQLTELTSVPQDYTVPTEVKLSENEVNEVKRIAKNSGFSQQHFDKLIRETEQYGHTKNQQFEETKKSLGTEKLNILEDYVKNNYPEKLHQNILNKLIEDKDAREAALTHRQSLLNTSIPGMRELAGATKVTHKDVVDAKSEVEKSRGKARVDAQQNYLNLMERLAIQNGRT